MITGLLERKQHSNFAQGDLWFATLLVDLKVNKTISVIVGVYDWEFAGPNDPAANLAQLGGSHNVFIFPNLSVTKKPSI